MKELELRRSVREFSDKEVTNEEILSILKTSMLAPSAKDQRPWEFIVIRSKQIKEKLASLLPNAWMVKNCSVCVAYIQRSSLKADHMIPQDMASCITYSLLKATELKIGSCWCGIYPNEERGKIAQEVLNTDKVVFALCAFGHVESVDIFKEVDRFEVSRITFME